MDELSDRSLYEEQNKAITAEAEACDAYLVIERDFNQAVQEEKELSWLYFLVIMKKKYLLALKILKQKLHQTLNN